MAKAKQIVLKKQINKPSDDLSQYTLLFVGDKKVGKTSLATKFEDHFILEFEPGNADHLECYFQDIHDWDEAKGAIDFLHENPTFCKTIIIDDIPSAYDYCARAARRYLKLAEDEKLGYTGYDITLRWFDEWVRSVERLPMGKIYTAHTVVKESETRTGRTVSMLEPSWTGQCRKILDKYIKLTGFILMDDDGNREMQIIGDTFIKANNGFDGHFLKNGEQIKSIPLGKSADTGYKNLMKAWNNEFGTEKKPTLIKKGQQQQQVRRFVPKDNNKDKEGL